MKSSSEKTPHVPQEADELIANISALMAEAEEMLSESTSHHAEEKIALLRTHHRDAERRLMDKYLSMKSKVSSVAHQVDKTIRACPYESLAITLALGVLMGAALSRRRE